MLYMHAFARTRTQVLSTLDWCGNFRYNWKNKLALMEDMYDKLDGEKTESRPEGVFKKVQWGPAETRCDIVTRMHDAPHVMM
jgi:hypothetical protein